MSIVTIPCMRCSRVGGAPIRHGMDGCAEQKSPGTPLPRGESEIPRRGLARESLAPTILVRWRR